jgi:hypothetical protein
MLGIVNPDGFELDLLFEGKTDGIDEPEFTCTSGTVGGMS